jgi:hypothetical protein
MSPGRRSIIRLTISLALVGAAANAGATSFFDPVYRYRTLVTEHFSIHFHQGEEALGRQLAAIAEDVWQELRVPLGIQPPGHTEVVLVDQTDLSNGFATPLPYNTIMVTAVWPAGEELVGKTSDWLRLVFSHELTHIVHLDRSAGWAAVVRRVFGRTPIALPNVFLPKWQIEGLATYEESRLTGQGRLHAGDFGAIVDEAARRQRLEPIDRVNGGLTDWPTGYGAYAYGAGFHEYLSERFGRESLARLAEATARRVPFIASGAFQRVYGRSLADLWREYEESVIRRTAATAVATSSTIPGDGDSRGGGRQLTHHGFMVAGPRFDPSACSNCPSRLIYSARTFDDFPALYEVSTDGGIPRRLANRYLGSTSAVSPGTIYFDQQELRRNAGLYSDMYALDRATGRVDPLTSEARLFDPDLSPDGTTLVGVQAKPGRRDLVLLKVMRTTAPADGAQNTQNTFRTPREFAARSKPAIVPLVSGPDTQFNAPRWSPDGRTIVAERHVRGRQSEIVLVDSDTGVVRTIASASDTRFVTPTWRPDGRAIVAAADFSEGPFNLYEISIAPSSTARRQLTFTTGGATWPDVSPDGRTLAFVGYTTEGFDLFVMPYPASARSTTEGAGNAIDARDQTYPQADLPSAPSLPERVYNPLGTLRPTSWSPTIEGDRHQLRVGFATGGTDVLGYHAYNASASWLATSPSSAVTPDDATPDWQASYAYARWRPTFFLSASASTSFFAGLATDASIPLTATLRERQMEAGVIFPVRHVRMSQTAISSLVLASERFIDAEGQLSRNRAAWRGGWSIKSAREYGYSISLEDGGVLGITTELARKALGSTADASLVAADGRLYLSPFARHQVLAVRLAGGYSTGDPTIGRSFHLGGPGPNASTLDFGRNAISLLRGFSSDTFAGSRVALLNLDYRWPIARPQRGYGTWPFFVHTVHGAVFTDVGHTWTGRFRAADVKSSAGAELSADVVAAYGVPVTVTVGAAWGRDGSRAAAGGGSVYVRVGRAF